MLLHLFKNEQDALVWALNGEHLSKNIYNVAPVFPDRFVIFSDT